MRYSAVAIAGAAAASTTVSAQHPKKLSSDAKAALLRGSGTTAPLSLADLLSEKIDYPVRRETAHWYDRSIVIRGKLMECDPGPFDPVVTDAGILSHGLGCDPGLYCAESDDSELGGFCVEKAMLESAAQEASQEHRSLFLLRDPIQEGGRTESFFDFVQEDICNTAPYDTTCDCTGLVSATLSGSVECQAQTVCDDFFFDPCTDLGTANIVSEDDLYTACYERTWSADITEDGTYSYEICMSGINTTLAPLSLCYELEFKTTALAGTTCTLTVNETQCNSCEVDANGCVVFDCANSDIVASIYGTIGCNLGRQDVFTQAWFHARTLAMDTACYDIGGCNLCGEGYFMQDYSGIIQDRSCGEWQEAAFRGLFDQNSDFCTAGQTLAKANCDCSQPTETAVTQPQFPTEAPADVDACIPASQECVLDAPDDSTTVSRQGDDQCCAPYECRERNFGNGEKKFVCSRPNTAAKVPLGENLGGAGGGVGADRGDFRE